MEENIKINGDSITITINPQLYSLETIYSASYVFLDRVYILLNGDPKKEIIIELQPKEPEDLKKLGGEFLNELINYGDYQKRANETKEIREMLLQRAIITNDSSIIENDEEFKDIINDLGDDEDYLDDPEGIAIPWEEKYGGKKESKENKEDENKTE